MELNDGTINDVTERTPPMDKAIAWTKKEIDKSANDLRILEKVRWLNAYLVNSRDEQRKKKEEGDAFFTQIARDPELQKRMRAYFDQLRNEGQID